MSILSRIVKLIFDGGRRHPEAQGSSDGGQELDHTDAEKVVRLQIVQDPSYQYFVNTNGDIVRARLPRTPGQRLELVQATGIHKQDGWLYYFDKDGDISRVKSKA